MDVYEAKYDYKKERNDVLSFTKGDKFYITDKTNDKWWKAKKLEDSSFGYVPSMYLKPSAERIIGRIIPECRRDTEEHKIHLRALAEIHKKVKPLPAHVIGQAIGVELDSSDEEDQVEKKFPSKKIQSLFSPSRERKQNEEDELPGYLKTLPPPPMASPPPPDYDLENNASDKNDMPFHHQLNSSERYSSVSSEESNDLSPSYQGYDESSLIKPKPVPNPVKESREHREMHRELRLSYKKGGPLPQRPELEVVHRERRMQQEKKRMEEEVKSRRTSMEIKLQERKEKERLEEEKEERLAKMKEQEAIAEERKPEFLKVNLKKTNSMPNT